MSPLDGPKISDTFKDAAEHNALARKRGTPPPFSLRLTAQEKAALLRQAGNMPLGAYIRSRLLRDDQAPRRAHRQPVKDERALGRLLAELGSARLSNNLNQLAKAVNTGSLPVTPDTEKALQKACLDVQWMRDSLVSALGLRPRGTGMILKAKERGNGKQLAAYLLAMGENEHVELHDLRGFASGDLRSALQEIDAISRGTKARNTMFSLSLNPPPQERVTAQEFEDAIGEIEKKLGLENQPRAVVFHEKDGRRHAHVVWSRIDSREMKAINLPHYKLKLTDVSRQLFLEHGWRLPKGLINSKERDPKTFSHAEWQQSRRAKQDPKVLKAMFQECWAASDSAKAFQQALQARGYTLARGDRRGHVAVDFRGEVYAVAKWTGLKAKDIRGRLGDGHDLPTIEHVNAHTAERMTDMLRRHIAEAERSHEKQAAKLTHEKAQLVERQRKERATLDMAQTKRWDKEAEQRSARLAKGFRGVWHRLTGEYQKTARQNEREALDCFRRDRLEKDTLIERHLDERQDFHREAKQIRVDHAQEITDLHRDIAGYTQLRSSELPNIREQFRDASKQPTRSVDVSFAGRGPHRTP